LAWNRLLLREMGGQGYALQVGIVRVFESARTGAYG